MHWEWTLLAWVAFSSDCMADILDNTMDEVFARDENIVLPWRLEEGYGTEEAWLPRFWSGKNLGNSGSTVLDDAYVYVCVCGSNTTTMQHLQDGQHRVNQQTRLPVQQKLPAHTALWGTMALVNLEIVPSTAAAAEHGCPAPLLLFSKVCVRNWITGRKCSTKQSWAKQT